MKDEENEKLVKSLYLCISVLNFNVLNFNVLNLNVLNLKL